MNPKINKKSAEVIVDGVIAVCNAVSDDEWSIGELKELFDVAIEKDNRDYATICLWLVSAAMGEKRTS